MEGGGTVHQLAHPWGVRMGEGWRVVGRGEALRGDVGLEEKRGYREVVKNVGRKELGRGVVED